jgi:hypothetical protein
VDTMHRFGAMIDVLHVWASGLGEKWWNLFALLAGRRAKCIV